MWTDMIQSARELRRHRPIRDGNRQVIAPQNVLALGRVGGRDARCLEMPSGVHERSRNLQSLCDARRRCRTRTKGVITGRADRGVRLRIRHEWWSGVLRRRMKRALAMRSAAGMSIPWASKRYGCVPG